MCEESGELTQALMKLLHKGKRNGKYDNLGNVVKESIDVLLIVTLLTSVFSEKYAELSDYPVDKLAKLYANLDHQENLTLIEKLRSELIANE